MRFSKFLLIGGFCMLIFDSCNRCSRQQTIENITVDLADLAIDSSYINMAQKVFYALPTPIEMSMLIKSLGIDYQANLLNDPSTASKYLTHQKMALNFGVYVTDLTYAGLFEQSQTVLRYRRAIQQLTEGLGLQSSIDLNVLQLMESNINDRDAVLRIIADLYASCTASLNENDRYSLTLAMLTGGWIEGMYIATSKIDEKLSINDSRVKQLVVDQQLTFEILWQAMSDMKDVPEVAGMMNDMSELSQLMDKINVYYSPSEVTLAADGKTSNITSSSTNNVTTEVYAKIKNQIQILRQNIIKK